MNLDEIKATSPDVPGYGGGQWVMYSAGCCWWTSFPEDLGNTQKSFGYPNGMVITSADGSKTELKDSPGLPCCPHCGSVLFQAPLKPFIETAEASPDHYGARGLQNFIAAHSRNANACFQAWSSYEVD